MESILISIRPEWCELIFDGKKTIENCEKCIHKDLCYENCELNYDKDDLTCHYCKLITCLEHTECKFFKEKSESEEIVRCKDCVFGYTETCFAKRETADNDFCSCDKERLIRYDKQ